VFSVSTLIRDYYGIDEVCLSLPAVLNSHGVDRVLRLELDDEEVTGLRRSAEILKSTIAKIGF
jgi:L-lactate dehydrogenase